MTTIQEIQTMLGIGEELIKELKKQFPDIGEPYNGKFRPYIDEYIKKFIEGDCKILAEHDAHENDKADLWQEVAFIECFCKWLEEEKNVIPNKSK